MLDAGFALASVQIAHMELSLAVSNNDGSSISDVEAKSLLEGAKEPIEALEAAELQNETEYRFNGS